ncbi:MAG: hypothetical protein WCF23_01465 [Candidatus Nitrosopolaris sp.]
MLKKQEASRLDYENVKDILIRENRASDITTPSERDASIITIQHNVVSINIVGLKHKTKYLLFVQILYVGDGLVHSAPRRGWQKTLFW